MNDVFGQNIEFGHKTRPKMKFDANDGIWNRNFVCTYETHVIDVCSMMVDAYLDTISKRLNGLHSLYLNDRLVQMITFARNRRDSSIDDLTLHRAIVASDPIARGRTATRYFVQSVE